RERRKRLIVGKFRRKRAFSPPEPSARSTWNAGERKRRSRATSLRSAKSKNRVTRRFAARAGWARCGATPDPDRADGPGAEAPPTAATVAPTARARTQLMTMTG